MSEAEFIALLKWFIPWVLALDALMFAWGIHTAREDDKFERRHSKTNNNVMTDSVNVVGDNNVVSVFKDDGLGAYYYTNDSVTYIWNAPDGAILTPNEAREILGLPTIQPNESGVDVEWFYADNEPFFKVEIPPPYGTDERR